MRKQVYFNRKPATNRQTNIQAYKAQPQTRAIPASLSNMKTLLYVCLSLLGNKQYAIGNVWP